MNTNRPSLARVGNICAIYYSSSLSLQLWGRYFHGRSALRVEAAWRLLILVVDIHYDIAV